jgi:hypothetical protein
MRRRLLHLIHDAAHAMGNRVVERRPSATFGFKRKPGELWKIGQAPKILLDYPTFSGAL